ncbi:MULTISPECIES: response regulator [Bacillus cereus group]|uniref:response regulator n=1 Tax=Bacillus cereus group TaxID=86661 RepID=UPI0021D08F8D|nr:MULTISPECIES: response regulator [Bacillus cereus group]MCU5172775.1 response regulator [Bacillus paranthracis]MDA1918777.1 response regulator [Bacillus cereus group sp. BcHK140]
MRAIIIDDEPLILQRLEKMLRELQIFHDIVCFHDYESLNIYSEIHTIDVAFLDIEMPEKNGVMLARELQLKHENIKIVFITGYERYAVEAFEIYALDYIMKPITRERLHNTIERLMQNTTNTKSTLPKINTSILNCLGELHYVNHKTNKKVPVEKWRTKKAKELFLYLVHNRNKTINRDTLIELLWPNIDLEQARVNLHSAIYQIRRTIHSYEMDMNITRVNDGYKLELKNILIDVDIFDQAATVLPKEICNDTLGEYITFLSLYNGDYFSGTDYWWSEGERTRLQNLYFQHALSLFHFYIKNESYNDAIDICIHLQSINPFEESTYEHLISLYEKTGNKIAKRNQEKILHQLLTDSEMTTI